MATFYSIGHSNRSLDTFVDLLRASGIGRVADVRSIPRSRTHPQFHGDGLESALEARQISYVHFAELGGRRPRQLSDDASPNGWWSVRSFQNYADYALTPAFADGLGRLRTMGAERTTAIMCAEAVWWRCHRRIITDWLLAAGETVVHILGPDNSKPAELTPGAEVDARGRVTYPEPASGPPR